MDSVSSILLSEYDRKWEEHAIRVAEEIKVAWRNQSPPDRGTEMFPCTHGGGCNECAEYTTFFQATTSDRLLLQPHLLWTRLSALKCFSPQYLAYFLPAFLIAILEAPCTLASMAKLVIAYAFPDDDADRERLAILNSSQIEAMNHFLELYQSLSADLDSNHFDHAATSSDSSSSSYDSASEEPSTLYL